MLFIKNTQLFCFFCIVIPNFVFAQLPEIKIDLKTNVSNITCLDNIKMEAKLVNWQLYNQHDQRLIFKQLEFSEPNKGFALVNVESTGEEKVFIKTEDGGKSWQFDNILGWQYTFCLHRFGKDTLVMVGKNDIFWGQYEYFQFHSYDNGQTWDSTQTNLDLDLETTFFFNKNLGYAVDENNNFRISTDIGITWIETGKFPIGKIKDIHFFNEKEGLVLTEFNLYSTNDSGRTWSKVNLPFDSGLNAMCFKKNVGFICSTLGGILKTDDFGKNWYFTNRKVYGNLFDISIINDSIFAVGERGLILFSKNEGKEWAEQYAEIQEDNSLYSITVLADNVIYVAGNFCFLKYVPLVDITELIWEPAELIISKKHMEVTFNSPESLWFKVTANTKSDRKLTDSIFVDIYNPGIFISYDTVSNSRGYVRLHALTNAGAWGIDFQSATYHDLQFVNADTGFVAGQYDYKGIILKTTDSGDSWNLVNQKIDRRIDDIEFINSKVGYASGYLGYLLKTIDGGENWSELKIPTDEDLVSMSFVSEDTGYVAAARNKIFKTVDGGETWKVINHNHYRVHKILFLNSNDGFLSTDFNYDDGGLVSTNDGGKTWIEIPHDRMFQIVDIKFVNSLIGYAVGSELGPFYFLKTVDGGKTWSQKVYPTWSLTTYSTVAFKDEFSGFVFNSIGEVITTGDGGQNWFVLDTLCYPNSLPGASGYQVNQFEFLNSYKGIGIINGGIFRFDISPEIKFNWSPDQDILNKTSAHPLVPANVSKIYWGKVDLKGDCGMYNFVEVPIITSNSDYINENSFNVFPQPAENEINIAYNEENKFDRLELIDPSGKIAFFQYLNNERFISISPNITSGSYILRLSSSSFSMTKLISFIRK